jgi:transposase-like protein
MSARTYSEAERAEAVALAAAIGPVKAARQLIIPRRTVSSWMHKPAASPIIAAAEANIADMLRTAHSTALASVMVGLRDPKARLSDRARALEVLGEQLALAEGRATSHNLNVNANAPPFPDALDDHERRDLADWLDAVNHASDADLNDYAAKMRQDALDRRLKRDGSDIEQEATE